MREIVEALLRRRNTHHIEQFRRPLERLFPVAAWIIGHTGSSVLLTAYKVLTVAICAGLLFRLRRHGEGEIGAWCALLILAAVSFQWYQYTREINTVSDIELARQGAYGENWLILD